MINDVIKKYGFKERDYIFKQNKLWYTNSLGDLMSLEHKCIRNVGTFKLFASHFECAYPYTDYIIFDTVTNKTYEAELSTVCGACHKDICSLLASEPSTQKEESETKFDPLAWLDE